VSGATGSANREHAAEADVSQRVRLLLSSGTSRLRLSTCRMEEDAFKADSKVLEAEGAVKEAEARCQAEARHVDSLKSTVEQLQVCTWVLMTPGIMSTMSTVFLDKSRARFSELQQEKQEMMEEMVGIDGGCSTPPWTTSTECSVVCTCVPAGHTSIELCPPQQRTQE
jgi:hypothetical protein